jgi:hypothetical protein
VLNLGARLLACFVLLRRTTPSRYFSDIACIVALCRRLFFHGAGERTAVVLRMIKWEWNYLFNVPENP